MVLKTFLVVVALLGLLAPAATASAHAELEASVPAADSVVATAPLTLDLTFTEEVAADGLRVTVTGPGGEEAQAGTAELDLNDPQRRHVTVSLKANLPTGRYTVDWRTTSNLDGDEAAGTFAFTVGPPASPPATPASVGTPAVIASTAVASTVVASSVEPTATVNDGTNGNPLATEDGNFDGRGFGLSIGVGLLAVVGLAFFWRAVRPKNPVFGGRSRR